MRPKERQDEERQFGSCGNDGERGRIFLFFYTVTVGGNFFLLKLGMNRPKGGGSALFHRECVVLARALSPWLSEVPFPKKRWWGR